MGRKYKKGECKRCGKYSYVNDHHITPKEFKKKENKETLRLCLACHMELHEVLPDELKTEEEFKSYTAKWLIGLCVIGLFIGAYLMV